MKLRKWMVILLAGAMCAGMLAGCGFTPINASDDDAAESDQSSQNDLMLILPKKDEYLSYLDQAAKASAEAKGYTLTTVDCSEDMDKQLEYVQAAVLEDAKVIIIDLADDNRAQDVIDAAGDIPVVFINRNPQDMTVLDETHIYVGSNESEAGMYQGQALVDYFKSKGQDSITYLMFQGNEGLQSTNNRSESVLKALEEGGITATAVMDPITCDYDRNTAMNQMTLALTEGLDMTTVDCIISNNDAMAGGAIEALKQNNVDLSNIVVVGVDGTNAGIQAVNDGEMLATVYQNAVAQASVGIQAAINLANGEDFMTGIEAEQDEDNSFVIWIPFELITADNVSDYY